MISPLSIGTPSSAAAAERVSILLLGPPGAGKTTQMRTLDPASTLVLDCEGGLSAVRGWGGRVVKIRDFRHARALVGLIGGPDDSREPTEAFSRSFYEAVVEENGGTFEDLFPGVRTVVFDSLTELSRLAFRWARQQPFALSEKTGKPDLRGAYGGLAVALLDFSRHLQHSPYTTIQIALLERRTDDAGRQFWEIQIEGSKTGRELPGIVDNVMTLLPITDQAGRSRRALVCQPGNPWDVPAKDRSGLLAQVEAPNLGALLDRLLAGGAVPELDLELPVFNLGS